MFQDAWSGLLRCWDETGNGDRNGNREWVWHGIVVQGHRNRNVDGYRYRDQKGFGIPVLICVGEQNMSVKYQFNCKHIDSPDLCSIVTHIIHH